MKLIDGRVIEIVNVTHRPRPKLDNLVDGHVPGVPDVQAAHIRARLGEQEGSFAIVWANPVAQAQRDQALRDVEERLALPAALAVSKGDGLVELTVPESHADRLGFMMAGAAAVLQCSWGWDESESIVVRMRTMEHAFRVSFDGARTHTAVELHRSPRD